MFLLTVSILNRYLKLVHINIGWRPRIVNLQGKSNVIKTNMEKGSLRSPHIHQEDEVSLLFEDRQVSLRGCQMVGLHYPRCNERKERAS